MSQIPADLWEVNKEVGPASWVGAAGRQRSRQDNRGNQKSLWV